MASFPQFGLISDIVKSPLKVVKEPGLKETTVVSFSDYHFTIIVLFLQGFHFLISIFAAGDKIVFMNQDCIFCKIVNKESSANVVFENDDFLAFSPIKQVSKGHTLLIPKAHAESISDIEDETLGKIAVLSKKLAADLMKKHGATGVNILHASGKNAQQSVFHFHIHIVPRYPNDSLDLWLKNNF